MTHDMLGGPAGRLGVRQRSCRLIAFCMAELFRDKAAAALPHSKGFASEYIQFTAFNEISYLDPKSVFINNFRQRVTG
jgi:hypothetical protein